MSPFSSTQAALETYARAVIEAPDHFHLTSEKDKSNFYERHVADAVRFLDALPAELRQQPLKVADIGSGNGVPGIPISLSQPNWDVFLIDSDNKKALFLDTFVKTHDIKNSRVIAQRSEDLSKLSEYREQFDLVIGRALAKLPVAIEYTAPFAKVGGYVFIPLAGEIDEQIEASKNSVAEMGLEITQRSTYDSERRFDLLTLQKKTPTPSKYPRRPGMATKRPL